MSINRISYKEYHKREVFLLSFFFNYFSEAWPTISALVHFDIFECSFSKYDRALKKSVPVNSYPYEIVYSCGGDKYSFFVIVSTENGQKIFASKYSKLISEKKREEISSLSEIDWKTM